MKYWLGCLLLLCCLANGQSVWLGTGLSYLESDEANFEPSFTINIRAVFPVSETAGIYTALTVPRGLTLDAGGWFSFEPNLTDPFGLQAHIGVGLNYLIGSADFGLALSGALSYAVSPDLDIFFNYTHRPLVTPRLAQAFDIIIGLKFSVD